jgi:hypothetical protein
MGAMEEGAMGAGRAQDDVATSNYPVFKGPATL